MILVHDADSVALVIHLRGVPRNFSGYPVNQVFGAVVINLCSLRGFGTKGHMGQTLALEQDLKEIAVLLRKYRHYGQMHTVEEILATLDTPTPDFKRLCGIEMWGGAGAVWDVNIAPSPKSDEENADREAFFKAFIRLAKTMNHIGLGTARSDFIAATFQTWVDKGL